LQKTSCWDGNPEVGVYLFWCPLLTVTLGNECDVSGKKNNCACPMYFDLQFCNDAKKIQPPPLVCKDSILFPENTTIDKHMHLGKCQACHFERWGIVCFLQWWTRWFWEDLTFSPHGILALPYNILKGDALFLSLQWLTRWLWWVMKYTVPVAYFAVLKYN